MSVEGRLFLINNVSEWVWEENPVAVTFVAGEYTNAWTFTDTGTYALIMNTNGFIDEEDDTPYDSTQGAVESGKYNYEEIVDDDPNYGGIELEGIADSDEIGRFSYEKVVQFICPNEIADAHVSY